MSTCEVLLGFTPLNILFQSIRAKFLTKLKQNQAEIVAEAQFNAFDHVQLTGHLLENCLRQFIKITSSYSAPGYNTQSVSAFISELWLKRWSSPGNFDVLRMFRNTMPDCHRRNPLIL